MIEYWVATMEALRSTGVPWSINIHSKAYIELCKIFNGHDEVFGGAVVLLSGDFRQTLPVILRSTLAQEINACLKQSFSWQNVETLQLIINTLGYQYLPPTDLGRVNEEMASQVGGHHNGAQLVFPKGSLISLTPRERRDWDVRRRSPNDHRNRNWEMKKFWIDKSIGEIITEAHSGIDLRGTR
ncbi:hypothetical protein TNCV_350241 [Trichonephila clavipes]|nr:hypothetical protein TNCV_350241 [Trichonephila clavipes]